MSINQSSYLLALKIPKHTTAHTVTPAAKPSSAMSVTSSFRMDIWLLALNRSLIMSFAEEVRRWEERGEEGEVVGSFVVGEVEGGVEA